MRPVTNGLLFDVVAVLEKHGFTLPEPEQERHRALGETIMALSTLVDTFEGRESA